ncbi:DODA-type extradiol aromatic ring-opening family dioxygenase [Nocardioides massiliensis]|uniref:2,3-dihydroxyphenylpropionate 1,2-dioxygenase n=1 Tax=Nocardioides massiliensis TaxID=1325935 RepID=A0ABT9NN27_9ACTN|nr:MEMO1 family protein [Nocardioides massiliensis]MDP9821826.1 2,3-dihydroxyphenylpropionate 1,2-dioxygenase [Nocardioides massiliensis]
MSTVVGGVAASHSTLMNTHWEEVDHLPEAHRFRDGLHAARDFLAERRPDTIVVIGSNHFRGLFLDLMPSITVGVAEVNGAGEAGTPAGPLPVDTQLAKSLVDGLVDDGFDPAFSLRLTVDHGITHSLQHLVPELDVPIVPVVLNMFAPPLIPLPRAQAIGKSLRRVIEADGADKRVAVIASGGLSHRLPWPDWADALSEDDQFLVEAWLNGREQWKEFEVRRRQIIRAAKADINPAFDQDFLAQLEAGDLSRTLELTNAEVEDVAGNGAQEIRSWIAMAAAVGGRGRTLAYSAVDEWLTGMGVAVVEPA